MERKTALFSPAFLAFGLTGCATLMNGMKQPLEIRSDPPVSVSVDGGEPEMTPVVLPLNRKQDYVVKLVPESGRDTAWVHVDHKLSKWLWGNALFYVYGLGGLLVDFLSGGAYMLALRDSASDLTGFPAQVDWLWNQDPRAYGSWHLSLAYFMGYKSFPKSAVPGGSGMDVGWQMVTGKNDWPVDLVAEGFFYSSSQALDFGTLTLLNAGLRKTLLRAEGRIYPYAAAGLTWLSRSTQAGEGLPLGLWARMGADFRLGRRFFLGPYLGYSKFEMVASRNAVNTGGLTGGMAMGLMW